MIDIKGKILCLHFVFLCFCRKVKKNMFEEQCDIILRVIYSTQMKMDVLDIAEYLDKVEYALPVADLGDILAVLLDEKFVEYNDPPTGNLSNPRFSSGELLKISITLKGMAFVSADTFVERKKRWILDIKTKEFAYKFRWVSWAISGIAIVISLFAYFKPTKPSTSQILLYPMQEMKSGLTKPVRLAPSDSLGK